MNEKDAAIIKVLTELGLRDDPPMRPEFENLYPNDDPQEQFYDDVLRLFTESVRRDNPGGQWLEGKQLEEKQLRKRHEFNGPYTTTGWFEHPVWLSPDVVASFKGARGEHLRINHGRVDELKESIKAEGFKESHRPLVMVDSTGQPWIIEGNHRTQAAQQLGLKKMPIELQYVNGGEQADGPMAPAKVEGNA